MSPRYVSTVRLQQLSDPLAQLFLYPLFSDLTFETVGKKRGLEYTLCLTKLRKMVLPEARHISTNFR